ncbi:MAG: glycosyltransferase family 4 protein, partial [Fimbriimonadaceae bacterium]|nr:glycosyltransferase family 4 protein [Chitinophagales bacterium]
MTNGIYFDKRIVEMKGKLFPGLTSKKGNRTTIKPHAPPEILFITSYPPRECGIATYSYDLKKALQNKFGQTFSLKICALESEIENHPYTDEVKYILNTANAQNYYELAQHINDDDNISIVLIQHEFGLFDRDGNYFQSFLNKLTKPIVVVFHTVLPKPDESLKFKISNIVDTCNAVIVMTNNSAQILMHDYKIPQDKISIISHGTHLVKHLNKESLKEKFNLSGRKILSTFGLISGGKGIETTLEALPYIIKKNPNILFLIIGKTHPSVIKHEGEKYRNMLMQKVVALQLQDHVKFVNTYLPLQDLLEYLQLTDIYLFTSRDPHQAVSGTFSYAISCGCPIISTPIPHACEVLGDDKGIIVDFDNPKQLAEAVDHLLDDEQLRKNIISSALQSMAATTWENSALAHAVLFEKIDANKIVLQYTIPSINTDHIKKLTTDFGIIQFSNINQPDINSGYTLDDNARALIALCHHYALTNDDEDIPLIQTYFNFIKHCLQTEGYFLNYADEKRNFTEQNHNTNLADANGRAIWALGYLISMSHLVP